MRLIFAGTPEFARVALEALVAAGHDVALVLTQPDRPAGRGMKSQPSAVKAWALAHGLPVEQPATLRDADVQARLRALGADVMVVVAYGLLLPQAVLDIPPQGCLNIHGSLLPRWRGAAPIHRAIEAGDTQTGITIMRMEAGLDTGPMLSIAVEPIRPDDTTGVLHDRLAALGAREIVAVLGHLSRGPLAAQIQPEEGVTYAHKIAKDEARIDWRMPADAIARRVRAFDPFPAALATLDGVPLKVWRALADVVRAEDAANATRLPGTVLSAGDEGLRVACGGGVLRVLELQRPGGRRLAVTDFLKGYPVAAGARLDVPEPVPAPESAQ